MESGERAVGDRECRASRPRSYLFAVRLWQEEVAGGSECRGSVREVTSGAFRNFRDWSELTAFMLGRVDENERTQTGRTKGGQ
jgi:hypothetical protein